MIQNYPLHWPEGWSRIKQPKPSQFGTRFAVARDGLLDEIRRLGGTQIILSTNVELRRDGLPYANQRNPPDPGVAVYFQLKGESQVFACDQWTKVEDNIQAIRKTIDAIRGIERWGSSEMMNRMFRGFQALPEGRSDNDAWWSVLDVSPECALSEAEKSYRTKAKEAHPDLGGSHERMIALNEAIKQARIVINS